MTALTVKERASGGYQHNEAFMFGVGELNKVDNSNVKTLLRSVAEGADSVQITITGSRNTATKRSSKFPSKASRPNLASCSPISSNQGKQRTEGRLTPFFL